jgi:hypothetical protein
MIRFVNRLTAYDGLTAHNGLINNCQAILPRFQQYCTLYIYIYIYLYLYIYIYHYTLVAQHSHTGACRLYSQVMPGQRCSFGATVAYCYKQSAQTLLDHWALDDGAVLRLTPHSLIN